MHHWYHLIFCEEDPVYSLSKAAFGVEGSYNIVWEIWILIDMLNRPSLEYQRVIPGVSSMYSWFPKMRMLPFLEFCSVFHFIYPLKTMSKGKSLLTFSEHLGIGEQIKPPGISKKISELFFAVFILGSGLSCIHWMLASMLYLYLLTVFVKLGQIIVRASMYLAKSIMLPKSELKRMLGNFIICFRSIPFPQINHGKWRYYIE